MPEVAELTDGAAPAELVVENARRKARAVAARAGEGSIVLGVDTDVVLDGRLLGKPEFPDDARRLLGALSGRTHEVLSGVVLLAPRPTQKATDERAAFEASQVTFVSLPAAIIDLYVASEEWRGRAGAYAVQGLGSMLVEKVEGDLSNVIGLPLQRLFEIAPEIAPKH